MFLPSRQKKTDRSLKMSAPQNYTLHGVKIRKLPVAKYVQVMRTLEDLPAVLLSGVFPECKSTEDLAEFLSGLDKEKTATMFARLLTVVPEQMCRLLTGLLDIPQERLLDPDAQDALSLYELVEVVEAFWKMNDMSDFFGIVRRLLGMPRAQNSGSSAGLPSGKASA